MAVMTVLDLVNAVSIVAVGLESGSTGTDVNRVFTSYNEMHSPCSN